MAPTPPPASIARLPPELLIAVFTQLVAAELPDLAAGAPAKDPDLPPPPPSLPTTLKLRSVCTYWRDLTDNVPSLWRHIFLDTAASPLAHLQHIAELFLARSQPLPVDVEVRCPDPDGVLPLVSPLLGSVARWRSFATTGFRTEHVAMDRLPMFMNYQPPRDDDNEDELGAVSTPVPLSRLTMHLYDYDFDELDDGEPGEDTPFAITHPTFEMHMAHPLKQPSAGMQLWLTSLPTLTDLKPLHFTTLTIIEGIHENAQTTAPGLLEVLLACPALQTFNFEGWVHEPEPRHYTPPSRIAHLPHLTSLSIRTTTMTRAILSSLDTPNLQNLSLTYLNVEHSIKHHSETHGEDGESDDEANDFSQSPWSDRSTGLGLRSLIRRGRPPIKRLEMDYSDLRTKDFKWVFDRLEMLEEFRIVASDMSDTVIGLLKPQFVVLKGGAEGEESPMDVDGGCIGDVSQLTTTPPTVQQMVRMHLRLPRLTRVELLLCQRLTGKAIVAALLARAIFTDSNPEHSHRFAKLQRVKVSGCGGVDGRQEMLLRTTLGPRFTSET